MHLDLFLCRLAHPSFSVFRHLPSIRSSPPRPSSTFFSPSFVVGLLTVAPLLPVYHFSEQTERVLPLLRRQRPPMTMPTPPSPQTEHAVIQARRLVACSHHFLYPDSSPSAIPTINATAIRRPPSQIPCSPFPTFSVSANARASKPTIISSLSTSGKPQQQQ